MFFIIIPLNPTKMSMIKLSSKPMFISLIMLISLLETTKSLSQSQDYDHDYEETLELYMHDVVGPTARPVTGLLGTIYGGGVPFSKPTRGAGLPGLAGTTRFFSGRASPDGLGFGTVTVFDDALTAGPEVGSQAVGRARGIYVATGGPSVMMTWTAVIEGGEYGDSINLCGVYLGGSETTSRLAVVGGTGKYRSVLGFAEVRSLIPPAGQRHQTLLRVRVHLRY